MSMYVVRWVDTSIDRGGAPASADIAAEIPHLQLSDGAYLVDGEQTRDALLGIGGSPRMRARVATPQDLPGVTGAHPTTDEIATFVQAVRRRRGRPEQQPVATDRDSVLTALNELLRDR